MKRALLAALLVVGVGAMALTRGAPPSVAPADSEAMAPRLPSPETIPPLQRNPFEFEAPPAPAGSPVRAASEPAPPGVVDQPTTSPRLIGFVRRGESLNAALVLEGDTVLLARGESALGYTVVSVDAEEGVLLRSPDGAERLLRANE